MFDTDELLSKRNQACALRSLKSKRDGQGPDGMRISDFEEYWYANHTRVEDAIRQGEYMPGVARIYELPGRSGKRREIANINVVDRFIERLLQQKLCRYIEPMFLAHSFAYQQSKGPLEAALCARAFIEQGNVLLAELDVRDYFGTINHKLMANQLSELFSQGATLTLITRYVKREVEREGKISLLSRGLLQGSSLSPVLSNLYLHPLDEQLENAGFRWLRFADNIYIYARERPQAEESFAYVERALNETYHLSINKKKSGIHEALSRRVLGYDFFATDTGIEIRKHRYQKQRHYYSWHSSVIQKEHGAYHIIQNGIINRKDYSLLFENDEEKHYIPVEVTDQINIYGNVTVSPEALRTMSERKIRVAYFDKFGSLMGTYTPTTHGKSAQVFLAQSKLYSNDVARLEMAKRFEIAGIHNMRANLRYYLKKGMKLQEEISHMTECIVRLNVCKSVDELMLQEARARRAYYGALSDIMSRAGFGFEMRTKRPPKDPANALISFGNTVLYNFIVQLIWKTSLDPKIGVVHATNRRDYSLNLDFADVFKPSIVDKVILSAIRRHEIKPDVHFRAAEGGAVLLNDEGKRIFLERFEEKLDASFCRKEKRMTYRRLISEELAAFQRMLTDGVKYRPYKHY